MGIRSPILAVVCQALDPTPCLTELEDLFVWKASRILELRIKRSFLKHP